MAGEQLKVDVNSLTFELTDRIKTYLKMMVQRGGSDLHIKSGMNIKARINGKIEVLSDEIIEKKGGITLAKELLRTRFGEFVDNKEADFVFIVNDELRFRVNMFFQMDGVSAVFRAISSTKKTIAELKLPESVNRIPYFERGLVLVTGVTGSGKSTTLAAIINDINMNLSKHIITIEDPIEFIHKDNKCIINQRSVGQDTNSFENALRSALREDPDIILVGEMRDMETVEMALHAAETGHLVFSTLHTTDAKETINRIVSIFPGNEQNKIRYTLANNLQAVISQRLVKSKDGGRRVAVELLFKTPRIENLIREGRDKEIGDALYEGKNIYGTQTFDQALLDLILQGDIHEEDGLASATSASDLKLKLSMNDKTQHLEKEKGVIKLKIVD